MDTTILTSIAPSLIIGGIVMIVIHLALNLLVPIGIILIVLGVIGQILAGMEKPKILPKDK